MKQVYILAGYDSIEDNTLPFMGHFYYPNKPDAAVKEALAGDCGFIVTGYNGHVYNHSDIDFETLSVVKTEPVEGTKFTAGIAAPTEVEEDCIYTLIFSKKGVGFNVRNNFTYSVVAKSDDATEVLNQLAAQINANTGNTGLTAAVGGSTMASGPTDSASGSALTIEASDYTDWAITGADDWGKFEAEIEAASKPIGDTAYVTDLIHQCAAGKGVNYLAEDGKELYPLFSQMMSGSGISATIYTLRFAVPRKSAKTRDEVVSQLVHIVAITSDVVSALDTVLGIGDDNTAETKEVLGDSDGE